MNAARVADLLRQLADELEGKDEVSGESRPSPPLKRRPQARPFPRPLNEVSETDRMRARQMLRRRGISG